MGLSSFFCNMGYRNRQTPSRSDLHVPTGVGSTYCLLVIFPYMKDTFYFTSQKETLLEEYSPLLVPQEVAITWWGELDKKQGGLLHCPITCGFSLYFSLCPVAASWQKAKSQKALNGLQCKEEELGSLFMTKPSPLVDFCYFLFPWEWGGTSDRPWQKHKSR